MGEGGRGESCIRCHGWRWAPRPVSLTLSHCLPARPAQDRVSPAWEMIAAPRHILLMLLNPLHSATCFQLPVYHPSEAERRDPRLYADNVRRLMVSGV